MKRGAGTVCNRIGIAILFVGLSFVCCKSPIGSGHGLSPNQEINLRQGSIDLPSGSGEYVFEEGVLIDGDGGQVSGSVVFTIENLGQKDLNVSGSF
jgi:hypothetical protein